MSFSGVSFTNPAMALTHCIALNVTSQLYSRITRSCTEYLYSICERPASSTATVANTAASSTTLTNTAVSSTTVANTVASSTSLSSTLDSLSLSTLNVGTTTQHALIVGTTTQPAWIKRKRHEYYVTQDHMTHNEAEKHCTDHLNSSLAFFTMATMYFKLPQMLHLYPDKYWVGGKSFLIIDVGSSIWLIRPASDILLSLYTVVIPLRQFGSRHPLRCYSKVTFK